MKAYKLKWEKSTVEVKIKVFGKELTLNEKPVTLKHLTLFGKAIFSFAGNEEVLIAIGKNTSCSGCVSLIEFHRLKDIKLLDSIKGEGTKHSYIEDIMSNNPKTVPYSYTFEFYFINKDVLKELIERYNVIEAELK